MRWRAVLYQQLSGKAAATIVGRVETALGSQRLHADTLGRVRTGNSIAQIERWTAGKCVESLGQSCCQRAFAGMPVCRRDLSAEPVSAVPRQPNASAQSVVWTNASPGHCAQAISGTG
jgi:hypothetical protein